MFHANEVPTMVVRRTGPTSEPRQDPKGEARSREVFSGCRRRSLPQRDLALGILQLPRYKSGGPTPRLELTRNLRCAAECLSVSTPRHTMRCRRSGQTPFSVPIELEVFYFLAAWLVSSPGHVGFCTIRGHLPPKLTETPNPQACYPSYINWLLISTKAFPHPRYRSHQWVYYKHSRDSSWSHLPLRPTKVNGIAAEV